MRIRGDEQTVEETSAAQYGEAAPTPSFADVARKITGQDSPDWLVKTLRNWAPGRVIDRRVAFQQPTRSKMRKKLRGVREAVGLIVSALNDSATCDFLEAASEGTILYRGQIDPLLRDLVRRAEVGESLLLTKDGMTKAGRNKAEPPGYIPPKTLYAAVILEAWSFVHGGAPAPKNEEAAAAAEDYWNASIGHMSIKPVEAALQKIVDHESKSWGNPLNHWRHHFKQAKAPAASNIRQEFRGHLKEAKYRSDMLLGDNRAKSHL
jgi:hypothetical protein